MRKGFAHLGLLVVVVLIAVVGSVGAGAAYLESRSDSGQVLGKNGGEPDRVEDAEKMEEEEIDDIDDEDEVEDEIEIEDEDEDGDDDDVRPTGSPLKLEIKKKSTTGGEMKLKIEDDGRQEFEMEGQDVKVKIKTGGTASANRAELYQIFVSFQTFFTNLFQNFSR